MSQDVLQKEWVLAPWEVAGRGQVLEGEMVLPDGERVPARLEMAPGWEAPGLRAAIHQAVYDRVNQLHYRLGSIEFEDLPREELLEEYVQATYALCSPSRPMWTGGRGNRRTRPFLRGLTVDQVWTDEAARVVWAGPVQEAFMTLGDPEAMYTPRIDVP